MRPTILLIISLVIAAPASAQVIPANGNYKVEVEGKSYRVKITDGKVYAVSKAAFTARTLDQRDRLREAVIAATKCRIVDDYWEGAKLLGKLDCSVTAKQEAQGQP